jgi:predicted Rossmann-fold nucleotide-binding protein
LNVEGYYDPLLALFDRAVSEGFVYPSNRRLVLQEADPHRLLDVLASYTPPQTEKWIDRDDS